MALAGLDRRETAVGNRWLAHRLHLGRASRAGAVSLAVARQSLTAR